MVVITVVAVVLITVFKVFSSVYLSYRQSEKYNTVAAVNAAVNVQKYYNSIEIIDTNLINPARSYVDLTNGEKYNSEFYSKIKEEYNITNIFLVDLDNIDSHLSEFNLNMRRYLQTIKNKGGIVLIVVVNNDEFAYLKIKTIPGKLCTYDGELVQGVEFIDGQYTYRYMQESNGTDWQNIISEGWGVKLTDKNSTAPVTTKLCTTINDKPIVSMRSMFASSRPVSINLNDFDVGNVTNMSYMFANSSIKDVDLSNIDTRNVTDMSYMFANSSIKDVDLSNIDTSNVTTMQCMFKDTESINKIDLSWFDMTNVSVTTDMFINTSATIGYGRTEEDTNILNNTSNKPNELIFLAKNSSVVLGNPDD